MILGKKCAEAEEMEKSNRKVMGMNSVNFIFVLSVCEIEMNGKFLIWNYKGVSINFSKG